MIIFVYGFLEMRGGSTNPLAPTPLCFNRTTRSTACEKKTMEIQYLLYRKRGRGRDEYLGKHPTHHAKRVNPPGGNCKVAHSWGNQRREMRRKSQDKVLLYEVIDPLDNSNSRDSIRTCFVNILKGNLQTITLLQFTDLMTL